MKGPQGSVFEPAEYKIELKKGDACEDLPFRLRGFQLSIPVKMKTQEGNLVDGPAGIAVEVRKLSKQVVPALATSTTDKRGYAVFDQITSPHKYVLSIVDNKEINFESD